MLTVTMLMGFIFAVAFMQSMRFNPRRTEDVSHALWNLVLIDLVGSKIGRLVPTPQYRLYTSAQDFMHLLDDAERTMPDSEISEVIPDFVILKFQGAIKVTQIWTRYITSFAKGKWSADGIQVTSCFIPLFLKLKRPVSRHCADIDVFVSELVQKIDAAQKQVVAQVNILFVLALTYTETKIIPGALSFLNPEVL